MSVSVLTLVRNRKPQLLNQLRGLLQSRELPDEWVVVGMGEEPPLESCALNLVTGQIPIEEGKELTLARARNWAAQLANSEYLVFLDVDCIPDPAMIGAFTQVLKEDPRLWMGSLRYASPGATTGPWTFTDLRMSSLPHPIQPRLRTGERKPSECYELLWSTCFAMRKRDFVKTGGFDEAYDGYGGEDTDFSFQSRARGIPFGFVAAKAYHQYHPVYKPPVNHFRAIIRNARYFRDKWGMWPMDAWLREFREMGLITFDLQSDTIEILREPTEAEFESAYSTETVKA